jgi:hypothetical protein
MVAANGDELRILLSGFVIPVDPIPPDYLTDYWKDEFTIIGGTGRFEGASGSGWTDDYNTELDPYKKELDNRSSAFSF